MIIEVVVEALLSLVEGILTAVLPVDELGGLLDVSGAIHWYGWLNGWAPIDESLQLGALTVGVLTVLAGVWAIERILRKLPFGLGGA